MSLVPGSRFGSYEIVSALGAGGMGEVYRARDPALNRDVALKILSPAFTGDPDRVARFRREAQLLAALNHPHIAQIYGLAEARLAQGDSGSMTSADTIGLVMELVDGETLAARIARGPIPLDEALAFATQIAEALEAAHEQGIIHRDLKPANIAISVNDHVKVLDFGLAKLTAPDIASGSGRVDLSNSPTVISAVNSSAGVLLGTVTYMAPEQARGKVADRRADIWAFGCVLYEMLTSRRAFTGEAVADTFAAILTSDPDWTALPETTPAAIRRLLRRALQRDPKQRLSDIRDARLEIAEARLETPASAVQPVRRGIRWAHALPWALAAILALGLASVGMRQPQRSAPDNVTRLEMRLPPDVELYTLAAGSGSSIAVANDGRRIAFVGVAGGQRRIYVRPLDALDAAPVKGTETATHCFFSDDGRAVGFVTAAGVLRRVSLDDGSTADLAPADFDGGTWSSDGRVVFVRDGSLWVVPATGGTPSRLLSLDADRRETRQMSPVFLPAANAILFSSIAANDPNTARVESLTLATGERRVLVDRGMYPRYVSSGQLVFSRDDELFSVPFDAARLQLTGSPVRVSDAVGASHTDMRLVAVASTTLAYVPSAATSRLVWVSRRGDEQPLNETLRRYESPRLATGGQRLLVQAGNLWVHDLTRSTFTQITAAVDGSAMPVWSPDGTRIVFQSGKGLAWVAAGDAGRTGMLAGTVASDVPGSISPDGARVLFVRITRETAGDLYLAPLDGDTPVRPILRTPAYEGSARFSPDGHWIAYSSDESGRMEVFVRAADGPDRRWPVSTEGGTQPVWNPNGQEIFYRNGTRMMAVQVTGAGAELKLSQPLQLFDRPYAFGSGTTVPNYDVSPDGQRFVMVKDESRETHVNVVLNWREAVTARTPIN
jgi:Tol biopolymer transport system component/tRNA A-37 threonylcarbamoyl transferase component Bud32